MKFLHLSRKSVLFVPCERAEYRNYSSVGLVRLSLSPITMVFFLMLYSTVLDRLQRRHGPPGSTAERGSRSLGRASTI